MHDFIYGLGVLTLAILLQVVVGGVIYLVQELHAEYQHRKTVKQFEDAFPSLRKMRLERLEREEK